MKPLERADAGFARFGNDLAGPSATHDSMSLTPAYVPNWFLPPGTAEQTVHIARVVVRAQKMQVPIIGSASVPEFLPR